MSKLIFWLSGKNYRIPLLINMYRTNIGLILKSLKLIRQYGSGALSGKMLLVTIIENNNIYVYFRAG